MEAILFDIDHFSVHDGDGIRTSIFLKGCPLSCVWCHSPESQRSAPELLYYSARCVKCGACQGACPQQVHQVSEDNHTLSYSKCTLCGQCIRACAYDALAVCGRSTSLEDVLQEALQDRIFYEHSGGGVTLSGGEILLQGAFSRELLSALHSQGVHTIVETTGFGRESDLLSLVPYVSTFYYDIKVIDPDAHKKWIGADNRIILENLRALRSKTEHIVLRLPLIPGITDTRENVVAVMNLAREVDIPSVHLLPFNANAGAKYEWIGRDFSLSELQRQTPEELDALKALAPAGVNVQIIV